MRVLKCMDGWGEGGRGLGEVRERGGDNDGEERF